MVAGLLLPAFSAKVPTMFTGIVEETGKVISFEERESAWRLVLEAHEVTKDLQMGDSVAVNGCCLTAVAFSEDRIEFDLLEESVRLTSINGIGSGGKVNLERALLPSTRMGGHFVSGHVDGTGVIEAIEPRGKDFFFGSNRRRRVLATSSTRAASRWMASRSRSPRWMMQASLFG